MEGAPTQAISENEATKQLANTSFGNRVSNDVAGLAYGVPAAIGTIATQSPFETAKMIGMGLWDTGKNLLGATGILGEKQAIESRTYYSAHPVLAALDVLSVVSLGAGGILKSALTSTARGATKTAVTTAAKEGIEASVINTALQTERSLFNVNRYVRGSVKPNSTFMREIEKVVRTGNPAGVQETVRALLVKGGVEAEKAVTISRSVATNVAESLISQGKRVKILDNMTHPVGATMRGAGRVAGGTGAMLLGRGTESAVGKFFDEDLLNTNKKTATNMERWLGAVVDERGWEQTTDNRFRVLREIKEQGEFQGLTQQDFMRDFDNYVKADEARAKLGIGNDYVLVKNLPKETSEAMADTLAENVPRIVSEMGEKSGDALTRTVQVFDQLSDFMEDNFGSAWTKYSESLRKSYGRTGNLNALENAVRKLSDQKPTLTMRKLSEVQQGFVNDIEGFGYQVGYAPTNKPITQAADVLKGDAVDAVPAVMSADDIAKQADINWQTIESTRNKLGRILDDFGFSMKGTIEGSSEFLYSRGMTQNLMGAFREKFGNRIVVQKPVVRHGDGIAQGTTRISIPVDRLYEWLRNHRSEMFQNRQGTKAWQAYRPISVFDLSEKDLTTIGFAPDVAKGVVSASKAALREVPASVTGIGEKLVNVLRAADGNFNTFGKFYDTYLKTANYLRYQSAAAVFFQAQQFVETKLMSAMISKDARLLPGAQALAGFGKYMTMGRTQGIFKRTGALLQRMTIEPDLADLTIARDIILPNARRSLQDAIGGAEFAAIRNGVEMSEEGMQKIVTRKTETGAQVLSGARAEAFWLQMWGGYAMKESARISTAVAEKFGLTLKEATAFSVDGSKRVYKYPRIVREMQDTVQGVLHYQPGFQTSPLVKTLNIVMFPFRFQAKSLDVAGKWLGTLEPMQRMVVVNQLGQFSNWVQTDEGRAWVKQRKNFFYSIAAYTTAWEQIGDTLGAVTRGQLFGGNAGLVGGVPFSFVFNTLQQLGILPEDPEQVDVRTGRNFRSREVPRELLSSGTALVALEEFLFTLLPGMPLYTITGGVVRGVGYRQALDEAIQQGWGWAESQVKGVPADRGEQLIERQFMRIPLDETRF